MSRTPQQPSPTTAPEQDRLQLLTEQQVSDLLATPVQTLRNMRSQRRGIPFVRLGRAVRYRVCDVARYVARATVSVSNGEGR